MPSSPPAEPTIRPERTGDHTAIRHIHEAVFSGGEAALVDRLRTTGELVLSLVAEVGGQVAGHVAFSRGGLDDLAVVMLGPIGVRVADQGRGVGGALIRDGLARLTAAGERAVFVVGDPRYYARFGFEVMAAAGYAGRYAGPHLMVRSLIDDVLPSSGQVRYPAAFAELG